MTALEYTFLTEKFEEIENLTRLYGCDGFEQDLAALLSKIEEYKKHLSEVGDKK